MELGLINSLQEEDKKRLFGHFLECIRITNGLTQIEFANMVGVSQSAVSKLEHGKLLLSAFQWSDLAQSIKIPVDAVRYFFLDNRTNTRNVSNPRENGYLMPTKYAGSRCVKVRKLLPLIHYLNEKKGFGFFEKELKAFSGLKNSSEVFPRKSFFLNLDNQVSLAFIDDLLQVIEKKISITPETISAICGYTNYADSHGLLSKNYQKENNPLELIKSHLTYLPKYHNVLKADIMESSRNEIAFSLKLNESLKETFNSRSELFKNFFEHSYHYELRNFASMASNSAAVKFQKTGTLLGEQGQIVYRAYAA